MAASSSFERHAMNDQPPTRRSIVVIGGSEGSLVALQAIVERLPADLPASIFVTIHIASDAPNLLAEILDHAGALPARSPVGEEKIRPSVIYTAAPDFHLLIDKGRVKVSRGPRENRHRPAIDPMFRSAARAYGRDVMGVILSGQLDDGASGLMAIKMRGGLTLVQDPAQALCPQMPKSAIQYAHPHHVLPIPDIAAMLVELCNAPADAGAEEPPMSDDIETEARKADLENDAGTDQRGKPSGFACPECHGVLWELEESELLRFRCRVGHAYTADALTVGLSETAESALWVALRTLEEKAALLRRLAPRTSKQFADRYRDQALGYDQHAETVRRILIESQELERKQA
jgi:two-component system, chemotaxis family, protein-glutamate methylesterase/glutaminase